jgi:hypothetical protein
VKGTQKPDTIGRESMVARLDRRMYHQCLEWAQAEGLHVRAVIDAILWSWFTSHHHHSDVRRDVLQRAKAVSEAIRTQGRAKAEERLPRWRKPPSKPLIPEPIRVPPPPISA